MAPPPRQRWYELTIDTLSPIHTSLGPAALLIPDEECDVEGGRTIVLDREALIADFQARPPAPPSAPKRLTYRDILRDRGHPNYAMTRQLYEAGWIKPDDPVEEDDAPTAAPAAPDWTALATRRPRELRPVDKRWHEPGGAHLVRYELDGTPQALGREDWWQSVARLPRTPDGTILLPGSGLKGALRSLLAYAAAERLGPERLPEPERNPKSAARLMERRALAPHADRNAPNYDAGRLLIVRDAPLDAAARARITPFGLRGRRDWRPFAIGTQQSAPAVEAIPAGITFRTRLAVDAFLLESWRDRQRGVEVFGPLRPVLVPDLGPLLAAGRDFAGAMLAADARFYAEVGAGRAAAMTAEVTARLAALPPHATLLRIGWGTGRMSKTPFGVLLDRLRPGQYPPQRSRRLTVERDGAPGVPFGWAICTVAPRGEREA